MSARPKTLEPSFTEGYALCTAGGQILGSSYRRTKAEAISTAFETEEQWEAYRSQGWTVEHVYARVFQPVFFRTKPQKEVQP